jgi:hypothetical protein
MDTWSSNFDISSVGQENFEKGVRRFLGIDVKEVFCGSRVMSVDIRKGGRGECSALFYMLDFLEDATNLEEVSSVRF